MQAPRLPCSAAMPPPPPACVAGLRKGKHNKQVLETAGHTHPNSSARPLWPDLSTELDLGEDGGRPPRKSGALPRIPRASRRAFGPAAEPPAALHNNSINTIRLTNIDNKSLLRHECVSPRASRPNSRVHRVYSAAHRMQTKAFTSTRPQRMASLKVRVTAAYAWCQCAACIAPACHEGALARTASKHRHCCFKERATRVAASVARACSRAAPPGCAAVDLSRIRGPWRCCPLDLRFASLWDVCALCRLGCLRSVRQASALAVTLPAATAATHVQPPMQALRQRTYKRPTCPSPAAGGVQAQSRAACVSVRATAAPAVAPPAPVVAASSSDPLMLRALRGEAVERPPIWMMRQAGRYQKVWHTLGKVP